MEFTSNSGSSANETTSTTVNNALTLKQSLLLAETNALQESEQWQARANELREASKQRRATARKKLLVEAEDYTVPKDEEMDSDEEQARAKASVAKYCSNSLHFQTTMSRLIRNDETLVEIDARSSIRFPRGHGQPLGEALLCNKVVKTLKVDLHEFLLAKFEAYSLDEIRPLLKFVSNSTSLVHFEAKGYSREQTTSRVQNLSHLLLDAISKNKQMEQLTWALPVCPTALCTILAFTTLIDLDVAFQGGGYYSDTQRHAIASAFRSNTSLQHLLLDTQGDVPLSFLILHALARAKCQLKYLRLASCRNEYGDYYEALAMYLRSTCSLERLHLFEFELTGPYTATLLSSLQQHRDDETTLPETHLRSLVLSSVKMDQEAGEELVKFLQTATTNRDGKEVYKSRLRDLDVLGDMDDSSFPRLARQIAESLLMATPGAQNDEALADELQDCQLPTLIPTIGLQIQSLSLHGGHASFLYHLRDHSDRVRLHTLELAGNFDDGIAFYKCIPKLVSLRKLYLLPWDLSERTSYWIVHGLQENGSIVEVETKENGQSCFTAAQVRLIDAYCQRNRMLNELVVGSEQRLVERASRHDDKDGTDIGNVVAGDVKDHGVSDDGTDKAVNAAHGTAKADLLHRPSLFQCTEQVPRTHATMLIRGLAVLGDSIGI